MHKQEPQEILHLFLTRFNVQSGGRECRIRQKPGWLEERFHLFETYCFPSLKAQTDLNFTWLVFFDSETPTPFQNRISEYQRSFSQFTPIYVNDWTNHVTKESIKSLITPQHKYLLTSRIDNDDAIPPRFSEELRRNASPKRPGFYNFLNGLIYNNGRVFRHSYDSNPFISLLEPITDFRTVWQLMHNEVSKSSVVTQLEMPNAWLQVVHGSNVSNRVKGTRVPKEEWISDYPQLFNIHLAKENPLDFALERSIYAPSRFAREASIALVKPIIKFFR